jgi:hypothetical protein
VPRKIDAGEVLAALGGALVFVALFLAWFDGLSGWEAFEALDLVLAALALLAIGAALSSITGAGGLSPRALPWVGALLLAIVVVQLVEPPPGALHLEVQSVDGDARFFEGDPDRETGAWLALAGSALVLLGGVLRLARISVTVSVGGRDVRKRVPAVDRRQGASGAGGTVGAGGAPGAGGAGGTVGAGGAPGAGGAAGAPEPTEPTQPVEADGGATRPPATEPQALASDPQATQPFGAVQEGPHG